MSGDLDDAMPTLPDRRGNKASYDAEVIASRETVEAVLRDLNITPVLVTDQHPERVWVMLAGLVDGQRFADECKARGAAIENEKFD